jgi:hypothetical protein
MILRLYSLPTATEASSIPKSKKETGCRRIAQPQGAVERLFPIEQGESVADNTTAIDSAADFRFEPGEDLFDLGGPASRFNHNAAAIKLVKRLEAQVREPGALTSEEQRILSRYTGWGDSDALHRSQNFAPPTRCR